MMSPACAEEANNGPLPPKKNPGCLGTQPEIRRILADVGASYSRYTNFGRFFAIFVIFQPLWRHSQAPEEPRFPAKVPFDCQEEHEQLYRSGKGTPSIEIWLWHFSGPVNCTNFGALGGYPIHVCESSAMSDCNFPFMLDTAVLRYLPIPIK